MLINIAVSPYRGKQSISDYPEFLIEARDSGRVVGTLGYTEYPEYNKIGIIQVTGWYRGKGVSDMLMRQLVKQSGIKPILSGQVNHFSYSMLKRMEEEGLLFMREPRPRFEQITMWELTPG